VLGQGTAVTLFLPRTHESPSETPPVEAVEPGGGAILLVEDNPEVAEITVTMLEQAGYRVSQAPNADSALDLLETASFDLC